MTEQTAKQRSLYPWLVKPYIGLASDFSQARLHHALLISSGTALGKSQLVARLTELIHCQTPNENKACGQCQDCQLHQAGTHADFYHVQSLENKTQISIEQVRSVSKKLTDTGLVNQRRIVFIHDADSMTEAASNALLKILEEPPKHVYFVLTTSAIAKIPATILSRCLKITLQQPPSDKLIAWLTRKSDKAITPAQFALLGNSPLAALEALENNSVDHIESLIAQCNQMYHAWGSKNEDLASVSVIELSELLASLTSHKTTPMSLVQLVAMLKQINLWIAKGQMLGRAPIDALSSNLYASSLSIDTKALVNLDSELAQLHHLLMSNSGVNGALQLQNLLIKTTDQIING
ncbi:MAG: AAA family ATPase [Psychrobium sp.]